MSENQSEDRGVTEADIQRAMAVDSLPETTENAAEAGDSTQVQMTDGSLVPEEQLRSAEDLESEDPQE
ncbi:hypothetical protein [Solicola sp. PLA-1-18]|uniref:hypothetical protein n=1 Tax=Solicola sp. PLA-1-18 TaxID=3380532 RepID=UPI003B760476